MSRVHIHIYIHRIALNRILTLTVPQWHSTVTNICSESRTAREKQHRQMFQVIMKGRYFAVAVGCSHMRPEKYISSENYYY